MDVSFSEEKKNNWGMGVGIVRVVAGVGGVTGVGCGTTENLR